MHVMNHYWVPGNSVFTAFLVKTCFSRVTATLVFWLSTDLEG